MSVTEYNGFKLFIYLHSNTPYHFSKEGGIIMDRVIFHADCNNFFASCECLNRPELKEVPMAVAGDPEKRVGIVVAKNEIAKKYGVKTTDTVQQALRKCPDIVFVPPHHSLYKEISDKVNAIYHDYTDYVEPASIDESYLDMTEVVKRRKCTPEFLADRLRARVKREIGITISVGVSYCKIFAKMGSDYKKPDATTVITRENYKDILWPLPVSDLLFAGRATVSVLNKRYIMTIGDLAQKEQSAIRALLGKQGDQLWRYANGIDDEPVRLFGDRPEIKSVSRGRTFVRDLVTESEVRTGLSVLADEVARTLRHEGKKGAVIDVQIRRPDMTVISRQISLRHYTHLQHEIREVAFQLIKDNWLIGPSQPIRALTVGVTKLVSPEDEVEQMSLFDPDSEKRDRQDRLEQVVNELRQKHGMDTITLGYQENAEIGIVRGEKE